LFIIITLYSIFVIIDPSVLDIEIQKIIQKKQYTF